jgi:hypothetical protein
MYATLGGTIGLQVDLPPGSNNAENSVAVHFEE